MKPMRIVVTGSRTWKDWRTIHGSLDLIADAARKTGVSLIVAHGHARGADEIADDWVAKRKLAGWPVEVQRFPAEWTKYGRRAGFLRNARMLKPGADVVLAFILDRSKGATQCADLAESEGIPTQRIERVSEGSDTRG
jgi:hypothetical protein